MCEVYQPMVGMTCIPQRIKLNMKGNYMGPYRRAPLVPIEFSPENNAETEINPTYENNRDYLNVF